MRELYPKGFLQEFSRQRSSIEFIVYWMCRLTSLSKFCLSSPTSYHFILLSKKTFLVRLTRQETSPLRSSYFSRSLTYCAVNFSWDLSFTVRQREISIFYGLAEISRCSLRRVRRINIQEKCLRLTLGCFRSVRICRDCLMMIWTKKADGNSYLFFRNPIVVKELAELGL